MIFASSLLALAVFSTSSQAISDLENYTFDKYVKEHKFNWKGAELEHRKGLFEAELQRVKAHNALNKSWKEGMNKFSAFEKTEKMRNNFGYNKHSAVSHEAKYEQPFDLKLLPISELPKDVDWRKHEPNVVTSVKDQGHCGSCWAFATAAVLESQVALKSGLLFDFSPQQIAMCSPNPDNCGGSGGCNGATSEIAFDYLVESGIMEEYVMGYNAYFGENVACATTDEMIPKATITGFTHLPTNNYTALMNSVAQVGPISISVDADTFHSYESGIFDGCNQEQPNINHAVTLVGYGEEEGEKYWLVRNSWSASYGEAGYIRVKRSDDDDELCGMDTTPHDGDACDGEDDPVKVCGTCGILFGSSYALGVDLA
jgi:cathepsin L